VTSADGKVLDPAVGNGAGYVLTTLPSPVFVRVTPQQQVIAVGTSATSPASIVVSRYDSTLHLDTSFGTGGSTAIGIPDGDFVPHGMTLQRDGKIVVIGQYGAGAPYAVGIVRLTAGGSPDPNFGISSDGRFESDLDHFAGVVGNAIAEDKKGRLVLAGYAVIDGTQARLQTSAPVTLTRSIRSWILASSWPCGFSKISVFRIRSALPSTL
jgi:hypothetical protein